MSNAIRSENAICVDFSRSDDFQHLNIEVHDAGPGRREVRVPDEDEEGGRGLQLVDDLAVNWGWRPARGGGKVVFAIVLDSPMPVVTHASRVMAEGQAV
ncbi:MAG: ATP-binding protein [Acidimicrobiales bacterium]